MSRKYALDGVAYPSVTTILAVINKPALPQWAANQAVDYIRNALTEQPEMSPDEFESMLKKAKTAHRRTAKEAATTGTAIHEAIQAFICGESPEKDTFTPEVFSGFNAFCRWAEEVELDPLAVEQAICHKTLGYAGRFDLYGSILNNGEHKYYLIDIKSSNAIYPEYGAQLAAYAKAYQAETGEIIDGIGTIRVPKDGGLPEFVDMTAEWQNYDLMFEGALSIYKAQSSLKEQAA